LFQLINQGCFDISFLRRKNRPWKPIFRPRLGYTLSGIRCSLITKKNVSFARKEGMLRGNTWFVLGKQTVCSGQIDHLFGKNRCLVWLKDRFLLKALLE
ncbi:MAG: hypothetical protein KH897_22080, partial [Bacteroides sp.]|uniref:hypothetical protein n=1 Tax=Bacteroides sp. TaxID=29523 RepID=UPI0025B91E56